MTDDKRVDPRYDPAFQRGFEGSVTSSLRSRPVAVQRSAIVTPAPFRGPVAVPDEDGRDDSPDAGLPEQRPVEAPAAQTYVSSEPLPARRLSRNPYVVTLVLVGAAMVVGGAVWANQARMLVGSRGGAATDLDYWFLQATVVGAPLTIIAGVGVLVAVLFFAASVWNRRG